MAKKEREKSSRDDDARGTSTFASDMESVASLHTLDSYHSGNTGYTFDSKDTADTGMVLEASHKLNTKVVTMSYDF